MLTRHDASLTDASESLVIEAFGARRQFPRIPSPLRVRLAAVAVVTIAIMAAFLGPESTAFASYSTSQIAVDDDAYTTYSVYISCTPPSCSNQNGQSAYGCFPDTDTILQIYNWWWVGTSVYLYRYTNSSCSGSAFASATLAIANSEPYPWFCWDTTYGGESC